MDEQAVPVLWLDIDGTVRESVDDPLGRFVNGPEDVRVFPEAVLAMRAWKEVLGGRIVGISNQGGIALGHVTQDSVMAAMVETQRQCYGLFDKIAWCQHHPAAEDPEMARCWCRKPRIGLIVEAGIALAGQYGEYYPPHRGMLVGDMESDRETAEAANLDFLLASEWRASFPVAPEAPDAH